LRSQHEGRDEGTDEREDRAEASSGNHRVELRGVFGGRENGRCVRNERRRRRDSNRPAGSGFLESA
jgi:hypothetical protein